MPTVRDTGKLIGQQLVKKEIITEAQLKEAGEKQRLSGRMLGEVLITLGFATEDQVTEALAEQLGIPFMDVSTYDIDKEVVSRFPEEFLREHLVIPLFKVEKAVTMAMVDPLNIRVVDRLRFISHCEIEPIFGTKTAIQQALDRFFGSAGSLEKVMEDIQTQKVTSTPSISAKPARKGPPSVQTGAGQGAPQAVASEQVTGLIAAAENAPIVKLVDTIIHQALENRASDIHIEPESDTTYLRYRIDGVLYDVPPPPKHLEPAVISRIKIMANMDIAERRLPQDGRVQLALENKEVDLRVSTFPTIYGENISMRVLDKSAIQLTLDELGFEKENLKGFSELVDRPHGILLVTGPTGCGKTTTLYGALRTVDAIQKNVITLEDPVEYRLGRVRQAQVDVKAGLTFANGLRSILRQDPDIVLIGEIRDLETSEIAIHAALTGHMVFATLHTNDAPGALTRLVDMGVEPFLAASSVVGVLAQRLVRTLCGKCKESYAPSPEVLKSLDMLVSSKKLTFYQSKGCDACKQTGYRGRTGVFELMKTSDAARALLLKKASSLEIRDQAIKDGMVSLRLAGVKKITRGITSVEEILRVTERDIQEEV